MTRPNSLPWSGSSTTNSPSSCQGSRPGLPAGFWDWIPDLVFVSGFRSGFLPGFPVGFFVLGFQPGFPAWVSGEVFLPVFGGAFRRCSPASFRGGYSCRAFHFCFIAGLSGQGLRPGFQICLPFLLGFATPPTIRHIVGVVAALGTAVPSRSASRCTLPPTLRPHRPLFRVLWALWQRPGIFPFGKSVFPRGAARRRQKRFRPGTPT